MKKRLFVLLLTAFLTVTAGTCVLAQINGRADTSKEGSLLIWPMIQTNDGNETYVTIMNSSSEDVLVKCYLEIKDVPANPVSECFLADFVIPLSAYTPVVFKASDGSGLDGRGVAAGMGDGEKGVLKCWAVDPTARKQISWNHLSGFATVVNSDATPNSVVEYSAWRFAANVIKSSGAFADGFWVGKTADASGTDVNVMNLKASPTTVVNPVNCPGPDYQASNCSLPNAAYDACPRYLTFDFIAEPNNKEDGFGAYNDLSLVPCKEDLSGATIGTNTMVVYSIWNENEVKFTGVYQCAGCSYEAYLGNLSSGRNLKMFKRRNLHTSSGRFRVEGVTNSRCGSDSISTPLIGVMTAKAVGTTDMYGTGGTASGAATASADYGYIKWTPYGGYYQKPLR